VNLYQSVLKPLLFRMDAETAHHLGMTAISKGWVKGRRVEGAGLKRTLFGVEFPNPVRLAAGFDKNALALDRWKDFGFGFVEVGTITRHAQPGNPRPRLFRLPDQKALINRMGFNNDGADAIAKRIEAAQPGIPLGINLGKSKVTELEDAAEDYAYSYKLLKEMGDYFVVNVSSPNTPGLRELQDKDHLVKIFWRLREIDSRKPLFVKIAPDLTEEAVDDIASVVEDFGLTGVIATNTTIQRSMLPSDPGQQGGLSGAPVRDLSNQMLRWIRERVSAETVVIGVGGITSAEHAIEKLQNGADLVQVYSGWVYGGPEWPAEIAEGIRDAKLPTKTSQGA